MTNNASTESSLIEFEWTRLLGTSNSEYVDALTTGSDGSIYIAGYTSGDLDGQTNSGFSDAFVLKLEEIDIGAKLENPWAIQFINDDEIIITEKRGNLIYANLNKNIHHIIKHEIPLVQYGQGGLLDIKFHKEYLYCIIILILEY